MNLFFIAPLIINDVKESMLSLKCSTLKRTTSVLLFEQSFEKITILENIKTYFGISRFIWNKLNLNEDFFVDE